MNCLVNRTDNSLQGGKSVFENYEQFQYSMDLKTLQKYAVRVYTG